MIKKTILLTGATGFLGSELLKYWLKKGHEIIILKRTTSSLKRIGECLSKCRYFDVDMPEWEKVFDNYQIDTVVHAAATYGKNGETASKIVESNTLFPLKLLDLAIKNGVKEFINTGSSLPRDINAYALSKAHFQDWLIFQKNEIHSVNLALEYFYGDGDDDWKFISMVIKKLLNNEPSIDFTQGIQKRDFIYISDVVSAFDTVLNKLSFIQSGQTISVGSGESYSLRSVVELCKRLSSNSETILNFGAFPDRPGEVSELLAETSKLEELGWKREYSLEKGILEFIKNIN